jgi:hypothetical protein
MSPSNGTPTHKFGTIPNGHPVGAPIPLIQPLSSPTYAMGQNFHNQQFIHMQPPHASVMPFIGQQTRPMGLPFGLLVPSSPSYNGYTSPKESALKTVSPP